MSPANTDKDAAPAEVSPSKEELLPSTDITGQKRKVPEKQQNRFKIVGRMVMAMQVRRTVALACLVGGPAGQLAAPHFACSLADLLAPRDLACPSAVYLLQRFQGA